MKKRSDSPSAEQRQLFLIFSSLATQVSDADDYGFFVGECVFDSLCRFRLESPLDYRAQHLEQEKFEEVKSVYRGFESLLEKLRSSHSYGSIMFEAQRVFEAEIQELKRTGLKGHDSYLFRGIFDTFVNRPNPTDRLRRYGLGLDLAVRKRKFIHGNKNCLLKDYQDIEQQFIRYRGDRRD